MSIAGRVDSQGGVACEVGRPRGALGHPQCGSVRRRRGIVRRFRRRFGPLGLASNLRVGGSSPSRCAISSSICRTPLGLGRSTPTSSAWSSGSRAGLSSSGGETILRCDAQAAVRRPPREAASCGPTATTGRAPRSPSATWRRARCSASSPPSALTRAKARHGFAAFGGAAVPVRGLRAAHLPPRGRARRCRATRPRPRPSSCPSRPNSRREIRPSGRARVGRDDGAEATRADSVAQPQGRANGAPVAIPGGIAIFEPHQAQMRLCTCARRTRSRAARMTRVANRDPAASRTMCR